MKAMVLKRIHNLNENQNPLELVDLPDPTPKEKEILVRVSACGICHTEWDEFLQLAAQMQIRPGVQEFHWKKPTKL
jgi:Zn-dependent alcohol dehydrogenase